MPINYVGAESHGQPYDPRGHQVGSEEGLLELVTRVRVIIQERQTP
jgi:hypothetical protein